MNEKDKLFSKQSIEDICIDTSKTRQRYMY